ncbi:carboxypeptidase regulatory-like domain-containing protein [Brumimicrobium oceani]|nr:carboxypeptidase regulatory-like domain-containing protein [Brumimicrobium oceani]
MKHFFSIFTFFIISIAFTFGQNITYDGNVTDMDSEKAIANVAVTVYANGSVVTSAKTSPNGSYSVNFLPGKNYTVKYTKSGYVTKIILLDVSDVVGEDMPAGGKIFPPINLDLFKERPGTDFSFLETEPVVKWTLDGERMNYNRGQMTSVKNKIEAKLQAAVDKEKNLEAEYNQLIKDADALYASKKYEEALNKYVAALQIEGKQKEAHPNAQLMKIEELLQKKEEEELAFQQENQAYLNLITAADNFASTKEYDKAIAKYNEAIAMKSDEQYPKDRVKDLKVEMANAAKKEEFDKIVKRADGFFKQNSLQAARDTYKQALKILPNEEHPKKQLEIISGKLDAQLAIKEQKDKYNAAVKEADELYNAEDYEGAIAKYEEALTYESAATYPPGRIKMAQDIIAEKAAEAEKIASFNKLVAEGDAGVISKDFETAVAKYTEAIALIEDAAVQTKLDNAKQLLADQKNKEQQEEQIATLMASAQEKMTAEDYSSAITDYSSVLALVSTHPEALAGKAKAETLLAEKNALAEKENQFNELLAAADKAFTAKTWQEAKTKYLAAQAIYDDKEHVNNRIAEVEAKIEQEGLNNQIEGLMTSANEKLSTEDYAGAITDFDAVIALKSDHTEAIAGKKNAEDLLAKKESQQAQEEEFNAIVADADAAFGQENWEEAKGKYLEAKAIFSDKEHVRSQLELVEQAIAAELAKQEDLAKIQTLLGEATALKPENKWTEVIQKYEEALAIKPERKDISELLAAAKVSKQEYEAAQSQEATNAQIQTLLDEASALKPENKWSDVIHKYEEALALDETRPDVSELLAAAKVSKQEYDAAQSQEATNAQIQTLLDEASALKPDNKWSDVIQKYEEALALDATRTDVSELLAAAKVSKQEYDAAQSQEATNAQIQTLLDEASALKPENKWADVIQKYEEALALDATRTDVSELLAAAKVSKQEWDAAQSQEATNAQIQTLLDGASALKPDNKWADVIQKYEEALTLDATRTDVSELLAAAKVSKQEWDAAQSQEALETEFNAIVADADAAFDDENWTEAKDKYLSAKAIFADREHVNSRIDEVNAALASLQANQESAAQIQTLLDEASALKPDNKWTEVIQKYEEALAIDDTRNDVSELLSAAKESKTAYEAAQSQGEQFEQLKQAGNELLTQEQWNEAKSKYEEALQLKADAEIEASLAIIESKLAEIAASENKEQEYNAKMEAAEEFASAEEYEKALESFKAALSIKTGDATATARVSDMQAKLDELAQAENLNQEYSEAMKLGKTAMENKDYSAAVKAFDDALIVLPADAEATTLKEQAKAKIAELQAEEEEYKAFVESALAKYDEAIAEDNNIAKLEEAKSIFGSAQNIRPEASLPQTKIVEIDNLLRKIEEEAAASNQTEENERLYKEQLELAKVAVQGEKYENAIAFLKEAQRIKPEETFPTTEITKYQAILDNASAAKELEANYISLIEKADVAFANSDYQNSIELYNEALNLKQNEVYPKEQIAKAEEGITNKALNEAEEEYQNFMEKANAQFENKDFENALTSYQSALSVKENDSDAKDKIDETQQILDNLLKAKKASESLKQQFDQLIADADQLFKGEKYSEATSAYRNALKIKEDDAYAKEQLQLSIDKAKEQNDQKRDKRYNQSVSEADNFFKKEEYESAKAAYKRALGFRNYEQYPKTQLAKITALINAKIKAQGSVAYIGEQRNISIIEGAALLQQGEIDRERIKQEKVLNRLNKFEGEEADRSLSDFEERLAFENEVTSIKEIRDNTKISDIQTKREIADEVDNQMIDFEKGAAEYNRFKEGELSRASQALVFANDDFDQEKADFRALHKESIEQIKSIENERNNLNATESAHHDVKVTATSEELVEMDNTFDEFLVVNEEYQQETERQVNEVRYGIDDRKVVENNDLYEKVIDLQDRSILAEMRVSESTEEKDIIQQMLKEDIIVYEAELQRKLADQASEVHQEQIIIDDQLTAAGKQFEETKEGKDDSRLRAVEQLKDIAQDQLRQEEDRIEVKKNTTEEIYLEVEGVKTFQEESARQNVKDLTVVDEDVTNRMTVFEKGRQKQENDEVKANQVTESKIQSIDKREELLREENIEELQNTYEELKGQQIRIENKNQNIDNNASKEKQTTQSYVDGLENNDIKFTETIANTIGDDYPEGVTQENYVREDSKGIPIKIVTRRIVVTDGRGEVYIRTQTRNGLTYSKNGSPITEQNWIYGTENANLEKHY